jgi:Protein of unknown function (DUF1275)
MVSESNEAGYGTMQEPPESNGAPITLKPDGNESFPQRLKLRMQPEVDLRRTHLILICLFFVTGLVDSAAYNIWSCFVSMQTGTSYVKALLTIPLNASHTDRILPIPSVNECRN